MDLTYEKQGKYLKFYRDNDTLTYDLSNGELIRIRDGKEQKMKSCHTFFHGVEPNKLTELLNDDFSELLSFVYKRYKNRFKNAGTLLHKLQENIKFESYIKIGMGKFCNRLTWSVDESDLNRQKFFARASTHALRVVVSANMERIN